ncbi:hypothetical protein MMC2321_05233 [Chitinophaga sp. MM2321]
MAVALFLCCSALYAQFPRHPSHRVKKPVPESPPVYYEPKIWPNVVYGSLLGPACGFGVNYDVRFTQRRVGWGARVGIGFAPEYAESWSKSSSWPLTIPSRNPTDTIRHRVYVNNRPSIFGGINYVLGQPDGHCMEVGAGLTYLFGDSLWFEEGVSDHTLLGWLSIGMRRHFIDKRFMFKVAFTPMFSSNRVTPNGELGFGYCFSR